MKKLLLRTILGLALLIGILILSFQLSPYPAVWIIRYLFEKEAIKVNEQLQPYVDSKISEQLDIRYDSDDANAYLDVYYPSEGLTSIDQLPVIVWTHGGGLISGSKNHLRNYCKILASKGYCVVSMDYTVAPEKQFPTPIQQLNTALGFLSSNSLRLPIDTTRFILAGDSGGSMIAATVANIITNQEYATLIRIQPSLQKEQLKGMLLYCGIYNIQHLNTESNFSFFLKTVCWAYFGKKDISTDDYARVASVSNYLSPNFPPSFISAGNEDPLLSQSKELANQLNSLNVPTDTLFFPDEQIPALGHEYQFTWNESGIKALEKSITFLESITKK